MIRRVPLRVSSLAACAGLLALSACGLKGDLEAAAPIWGDPVGEARAAPTGIIRDDRSRLGDEADILLEDLDSLEAPEGADASGDAASADPS